MTETTTTLTAGVLIVLAFPHQRIADMVTTAVESPVGDWFRGIKTSAELRRAGAAAAPARGYPWYTAAALYARPDFQMQVMAEDRDDAAQSIVKTLTLADFQRALILMATKDDGAYSRHFADFLRNNEDANTADLFLQLAVYGDEVFA